MCHKKMSTKKKNRWLLRIFSQRIKSISVIGITFFTLSVSVMSYVSAATLHTEENHNISQFDTSDFQDLSNPVKDFINDINSFVRGNLFGSVSQFVKNALGPVEVPDLGQVVTQIMTNSLPEDAATGTKFENNLTNSYAIRLDLANQSERVGAIEVAQTKTLSHAAQKKSKEILEQSANSALESTQMSDNSQHSDTSQQILQNISVQLKNNTNIAHLQLQEASQARQDRALGMTLIAQTAQELNAANTGERQTKIATANSAVSQSTLLTMPGSAVLGQ